MNQFERKEFSRKTTSVGAVFCSAKSLSETNARSEPEQESKTASNK